MGYLQLNVMDHEKLIQKHAAELGIPEVRVTTYKFNGPAAMNDALLVGQHRHRLRQPAGPADDLEPDTRHRREVRAISALATLPFALNTNDPTIKTIDDLARCKKIAVPAVKVSAQAVTIQAAAAKAYGIKEYARYDQYTVSMSPPDAPSPCCPAPPRSTAIFAVPPYMQQQLQNPSIHTRVELVRHLGRPQHLHHGLYVVEIPHQEPGAVQGDLRRPGGGHRAGQCRSGRPLRATGSRTAKSKLPVDFVKSIATAPGTTWTMAPQGTEAIAAFMNEVGSIKVKPTSWKRSSSPRPTT